MSTLEDFSICHWSVESVTLAAILLHPLGNLSSSKGPQVSLLEGNRIQQHDWLMPRELTHEQNRVAIVDSLILKIFNRSKYYMVTIQPFLKTLICSVPALFIVSFYCLTLVHSVLLFDSVLCSIVQCLNYSVCFLFWHRKYFQVFQSRYTNRQSINIIKQTAPSLS
jgi:hypothetical protein